MGLKIWRTFLILTIFVTPAVSFAFSESAYTSRYFRFEPLNFQATDIGSAKTLESALQLIPEEIRKSYVLMHTSGSLQEASYRNPRAILFSPTADLILSFNGHLGQAGGNTIEAMQFNSITESYDFHEYQFTESGIKHSLNSRKCQVCHTDAQIPNWRPYQDWRGAYGELQNLFTEVSVDGPRGVKFVRADTALKNFIGFRNAQSSHGRYKLLLSPTGESMWPFGPSSKFDGDDFDYSPNRRLGLGLTWHHGRSQGAKLARTQLFKDYPASVIFGLLRCSGSADFQSFKLKLFSVYKQSLPASVDPEFGADKSGFDFDGTFLDALSVTGVLPETWILNHSVRGPFTPSHKTKLMFGGNGGQMFFSGGYGMNRSTDIAGAYLYARLTDDLKLERVPEDLPSDIAPEIGAPADLVVQFSRLAPLYRESSFSKICKQLAPLAKREIESQIPIMSELKPQQIAKYERLKSGIPYALDKCIGCHVDGIYRDDVPYIPFDDPLQLRIALRENHFNLLKKIKKRTAWEAPEEIKMPLGAFSLTPVLQKHLIQYFEKVSTRK